MAEQIVQSSIRDEIFKVLRASPQNNVIYIVSQFCLDCQKKNPRWASVYLGIHLCIDCAGKHRQFGVMFSFIKSTNLDSWNRRQLTFMEKGGNTRALDYFKKCGIITPTNKHIDYKSAIVQKYKGVLTQEVDGLFQNNSTPINLIKPPQSQSTTIQQSSELQKKGLQTQTNTNIQNKADEVEDTAANKGGKGKKKKFAKKIQDDIDFGTFDDGISQVQKEKMSKPAEPPASEAPKQTSESGQSQPKIEAPKIEAPKEMQATTAKQTLDKLKQKDNIKALSSDTFKDNNVSSSVLQQNLNKFSGSSAISSAAFFGQQQPKQEAIDKLKVIISSAGQKIYGKLSSLGSYLGKS